MIKKLAFLCLLGLHIQAFCFNTLDSKYQVHYGSEEAPLQLVEYFSFNCPKCLQFIQKDFKVIKEKYIDSGEVRWTFHPDPADMITLQAMICLENLPNNEKQAYLEALADRVEFEDPLSFFHELNAKFGMAFPHLGIMDFIEKSNAFHAAYQYLIQEDTVKEVPTIQINGVIERAFPSLKLIEAKIKEMREGHHA